MNPVEQLMMRVVATCGQLDLTYFVTGSVASMAWGESRHTIDVDIVVELASWKVKDADSGRRVGGVKSGRWVEEGWNGGSIGVVERPIGLNHARFFEARCAIGER